MFFADTGAIAALGVVIVQEYDSSAPPQRSLGLDENHPTPGPGGKRVVLLLPHEHGGGRVGADLGATKTSGVVVADLE